MMSNDIFKERVFPLLDKGEKIFLIVIDNFRYDQWRVLMNEIGNLFTIEEELYTSILPTSTQYARNAIFSGLMPSKIKEMYPALWVDEEEDEGKNLNESSLIETQIARFRRKDSFSYNKVLTSQAAEKYLDTIKSLSGNALNVLVINFIDMLSHARTESVMVRELASSEAAYRSITLSWLRHSSIIKLFRYLADSGYTTIITTDHGSVQVDNAIRVVGDKNTNTNLRYKLGKALNYNPKEVYEIKEPAKAFLPSPNLSTSYIFATGNDFFAYPNNYNHYVGYYKDTFQHGGISKEEMLVPLALSVRKEDKKHNHEQTHNKNKHIAGLPCRRKRICSHDGRWRHIRLLRKDGRRKDYIHKKPVRRTRSHRHGKLTHLCHSKRICRRQGAAHISF